MGGGLGPHSPISVNSSDTASPRTHTEEMAISSVGRRKVPPTEQRIALTFDPAPYCAPPPPWPHWGPLPQPSFRHTHRLHCCPLPSLTNCPVWELCWEVSEGQDCLLIPLPGVGELLSGRMLPPTNFSRQHLPSFSGLPSPSLNKTRKTNSQQKKKPQMSNCSPELW